jgi:hypothetical protein
VHTRKRAATSFTVSDAEKSGSKGEAKSLRIVAPCDPTLGLSQAEGRRFESGFPLQFKPLILRVAERNDLRLRSVAAGALQQGCSKWRRRQQIDRLAKILDDQVPVGSGRAFHVAMTEQALNAVGIDALAKKQRRGRVVEDAE